MNKTNVDTKEKTIHHKKKEGIFFNMNKQDKSSTTIQRTNKITLQHLAYSPE